MNTLGECLRFAREKRGHAQDSLAKIIGISRGVIYSLKKNKTESQMIAINTICQTLDINRGWLFYGRGEMEDRSKLSKGARTLVELCGVARDLSEDEQLYPLDVAEALELRLSKGAR